MNSLNNRCIAINKNNKKCRAKIKNNELFCCESHYPINKELIEEGCFICNEKINNSNEIIYFICKHAFHKSCYIEWLEYSTYEKPICLLCRINVIKDKDKNIKKPNINKINNIIPLLEISNKLNDSLLFYVYKNNDYTYKNNINNINNNSKDFLLFYNNNNNNNNNINNSNNNNINNNNFNNNNNNNFNNNNNNINNNNINKIN
jgi:hypothetical protein